MNTNPCISAIQSKYSTLTAVERKIADYIMLNREKIIAMSIGELAENSGCVKSAVIRLCKSLDFSGYSEFKIALAFELSKNVQLNYTPYISPSDSTSDILDKVFSANVKTLHDTAEKIDRSMIDNVVNMLAEAENIYIYAVGNSSVIANDFCYRLIQTGCNAFCITDVVNMLISTMNIKKGDAAIGFSHSGRTAATVDALVHARKQGAKTACITSYHDSKITKICDYPIEIFSDEVMYPIEAVSASVAHMSVADAITVAVSSKNYEQAFSRSAKSHELINTLRY